MQKKIWGGQDGGKRRNKVIVKMQKKIGGGWEGGGDPVRDSGCVNEELKGGAGPGGQGGCIEVIVKFEEKSREEVRSGSLVGGAVRWRNGWM